MQKHLKVSYGAFASFFVEDFCYKTSMRDIVKKSYLLTRYE